MWFDSQEKPGSLEATIARQICEDPEQVYRVKGYLGKAQNSTNEQLEEEK